MLRPRSLFSFSPTKKSPILLVYAGPDPLLFSPEEAPTLITYSLSPLAKTKPHFVSLAVARPLLVSQIKKIRHFVNLFVAPLPDKQAPIWLVNAVAPFLSCFSPIKKNPILLVSAGARPFLFQRHATLLTYSVAPLPKTSECCGPFPFPFSSTKSTILLVYAGARPLLVSPKEALYFDNLLYSLSLYRKPSPMLSAYAVALSLSSLTTGKNILLFHTVGPVGPFSFHQERHAATPPLC